MKSHYVSLILVLTSLALNAQTNIISTNPVAETIITGQYDPADYQPSITTPLDQIPALLQDQISADSLKSYLEILSTFKNRNTGADTVSTTEGIGATRRWIHKKFEQFSSRNENRLVTSYLQFDQDICGMGQHRNIFTVLPGTDVTNPSIIIIEAHVDSRCAELCDINCPASGMEDNGSGTALVLELARVMGKYSFPKTLVFMATIGEEQGLHGANAFARYTFNNRVNVKAVLNNDIVGGIICGATSSAPSCPGENEVDSTQVRIFSSGSSTPYKALARYVKLQYQQHIQPITTIPMQVTLMNAEDRTGRGGDHIPFRQLGMPAIRFTSAHEHGNANINDPDYHDRQHTSDDVLGVDTDGDNIIDSFFVDFNYLARNAVINGNAATSLAYSPPTPELSTELIDRKINITITDSYNYDNYLIAIRKNLDTDYDTVIEISNQRDYVFTPTERVTSYHISVAGIDSTGTESCFTPEQEHFVIRVKTNDLSSENKDIILLQNRPNPFDETTYLGFYASRAISYKEAFFRITDVQGKVLKEIPVEIQPGTNEVLYRHGYHMVGTFHYGLYIDGKLVETKSMIFAN